MSGGQCLSKLCGTLARFEFDDEALSGSNRERKIPLRNAKSPTRLGDCHPKLLCVLDPHLTDREDTTVWTAMVTRILPIGKKSAV